MATLNHDEVVRILGRIDDLRVAEILATGATSAEVLEAKNWTIRGGYVGKETKRSLHGAALKVYEILPADERDWEEDR